MGKARLGFGSWLVGPFGSELLVEEIIFVFLGHLPSFVSHFFGFFNLE